MTDEERSRSKIEKVRKWVHMRINVVGYVINDSFMWYMGFKSMRNDRITIIKAQACRKRISDG